MDTLTVKIHEYNEENHSLIVSFTTDQSDLTVDETEKFNFDIHNYNPQDIDDTIKKIAESGARIALAKWNQQQSKNNTELVDSAKESVGKVFNFQISELIRKQEDLIVL